MPELVGRTTSPNTSRWTRGRGLPAPVITHVDIRTVTAAAEPLSGRPPDPVPGGEVLRLVDMAGDLRGTRPETR